MIRKIIRIDESLCNGCGECAAACHEGAIAMLNGKAQLVRDDYCDGLGDCLPVCPTGALSFEEREAAPYDRNAVIAQKDEELRGKTLACGCAGTQVKTIEPNPPGMKQHGAEEVASELRQWPVKIKLVPVNAPFFNGAHLLVAADCTAYAYGSFHEKFMKNRITLIGCPKLDNEDYSEKLTAIIKINPIKSVTVVRMEVPCCSGIESAVKKAVENSGRMVPWQVFTLSSDGRVIE